MKKVEKKRLKEKSEQLEKESEQKQTLGFGHKVVIAVFLTLIVWGTVNAIYLAIINRPLISKCGEPYKTGAREKYVSEVLNLCLEPQRFPYSMDTIIKNKDVYYWFSLHFDKKINYNNLNEKKKLNIICDSLNSLYEKSAFNNIYIKLDYPFNLRVSIIKSKSSCDFLVTHKYKIRTLASNYYKNLHSKLFSYNFTTIKHFIEFLNQINKYNEYKYYERKHYYSKSASGRNSSTTIPSNIYIISKDVYIDDVENFYWSDYLYKILKIINQENRPKAEWLDEIDLGGFATLLANKLDVPIKIR